MTSVSVSGERSEAFQRNMITASVMMATTVVIIDMTIATIALPHMQGGLSASQDQVSWVMTTYFMMQAITMSATGWLTDEYSWRWVFYVSMPFSLLGILGAIFFIRETPRDLERKFDWFGFSMLAIALAATQFLLDRGESEGWFDSDLIITTGVIVALAFYLFVAHSATTKNPFISPTILKNRNYMLGLLFMFLLGVLVLSMNVIMPLFLQNARGYPILTAALVMMPRGLGSLFGLVLAGKLSGKMDPRWQIAIGVASTAYSAWLFSTFTTDVGLWTFVFAAFFNGIGIGLIFVPLTAVSFWTLPQHLRTEASTFTSLFRNYGSGIGVSIVISVLSRSQATSHAYLAERTSP